MRHAIEPTNNIIVMVSVAALISATFIILNIKSVRFLYNGLRFLCTISCTILMLIKNNISDTPKGGTKRKEVANNSAKQLKAIIGAINSFFLYVIIMIHS